MKKFYIIILLFCSTFCFAQYNLVPNPSFEQFDTCPSYNNGGNIYWAPPWTNPLYLTTPDYFNSCDSTLTHSFGVPANYVGYEPARTGVAYADIVAYYNFPNPQTHGYREYIQAPLNDSLIAGVDYCIRFYVSACDSCLYISNNIGVYFSSVQIKDTCPVLNACNLPYIPQFENPSTNNLNSRNGWTLISGSYTATGSEKFIIIGNFRDTNSTVASYTGWGYWPVAAYYIDDILLAPCDSLLSIQQHISLNPQIRLFPSLSQNQINIESENEMIQQVKIYSIVGELILDGKVTNKKRNISINVSALEKGVYMVCVTTSKNKFNLKFIKN